MHYEHQGMRLWVEPDDQLAGGAIEPGSDVNITVGVEPADASNQVHVRYRVNGGPAATIVAEPVRHVGKAQYFKAQLPCAALCEGDTVEYAAACQCAGKQVPSVKEAEEFASSFRVMSNSVDYSQATTELGSVKSTKFIPRTSSIPPGAEFHLGTSQQTIQHSSIRTLPTHLSLFVSTLNQGHPVARMPFYAEVCVVSVLPRPKCNLQDAIRSGINEFIILTSVNNVAYFQPAIRELSEKLVEPLCDALYRLLAPEIVDQWVKDQTNAASVVVRIIQAATELAKDRKMDWNNPRMLGQLLEEAILTYAKENSLPLAEKNAQSSRIAWAHPLGVLATDHVGYLSFDLTRLPPDVAKAVALALEARRRNPNAPTDTTIWLYPMAQEEKRIDALEQMRFAHDAIVVKLELDLEFDPILCQPKLCESLKNLGFPAMQNPSLTDWRLSPASFATNPSALLGEDGCENLLPANIALQEFHFYQIVRLSDIQSSDLPSEIEGKVKFGVAHEYRLAWYPLGHSLGQIQYSLPLAPGESVNLAVIDWTRRDAGSRTEDTSTSEQLVHDQRRDRMVTETVNAAIKEYQEGSSFMAGLAQSTGIAGTLGKFGIASGLAGSLGGSSSDSKGSRDIAASTVQKLSDNITQSSASMRELQSTVVVQTTQHEKESIETRTVVNYNHSHALTILYYEVLRHFRVVTEYVRSRPIVLAKVDTDFLSKENLVNVPKPLVISSSDPGEIANLFHEHTLKLTQHAQTIQNLIENRSALEAALLDKRHIEGFNALQRAAHRRNVANITPPPPALDPPPSLAGPLLRFFEFDIKTGPNKAQVYTEVYATLYGPAIIKGYSGEEVKLWEGVKIVNHGPRPLCPYGSFRTENAGHLFTGITAGVPPIPWGAIDLIAIDVRFQENTDGSQVSFEHIKVTGIDIDGNRTPLVDRNYNLYTDNDWRIILPTLRPQPAPPPPPPSQRPIEEIEDDAKINELIDHLRYHRAHYSRALYLNQNVAERARQLDNVKLSSNTTLLEKVENRPLEMLGDFVAYPCANSDWATMIKNEIDNLPPLEDQKLDERLITLPTRGIFAEAKLGHCNASEIIQDNRFWKWEEHAIPHLAPDIAAIQAGQHTVKDLDLKPSPFPQSLVNIVNPPNAPDPGGLAAAMNVLGTPNIFRDLSGRAETADLLKKLSDNSISIAEAANRAKEIQAKYGDGSPNGKSGSGSRTAGNNDSSGAAINRPSPSEQQRQLQVFKDARKDNLITEPRSQQMADEYLQNNINGQSGFNIPEYQYDSDQGSRSIYQNISDQGRNIVDTDGAPTGSNLITDSAMIGGSLALSTFLPKGERQCFPVSEFKDAQFASGIGTFAERYIEDDYCETLGCSAGSTYIDKNNPTEYKDFLITHNPSFNKGTKLTKLIAEFASGVKRPDIMTDDGTRKEFYEIKPFSPSGAAAGVEKLAYIVAFMKLMKLPYVAGTTYSPSKDIPIMAGSILGSKIGISLNVQRYVPGIITYSICFHGELSSLLSKVTIAALLAWMVIELLPVLALA